MAAVFLSIVTLTNAIPCYYAIVTSSSNAYVF